MPWFCVLDFILQHHVVFFTASLNVCLHFLNFEPRGTESSERSTALTSSRIVLILRVGQPTLYILSVYGTCMDHIFLTIHYYTTHNAWVLMPPASDRDPCSWVIRKLRRRKRQLRRCSEILTSLLSRKAHSCRCRYILRKGFLSAHWSRLISLWPHRVPSLSRPFSHSSVPFRSFFHHPACQAAVLTGDG